MPARAAGGRPEAELRPPRRRSAPARTKKVRTHIFPEDRVTDHRVKLTRGNIQGVLDGELDEILPPSRRGEASQARAARRRRVSDLTAATGASRRRAQRGRGRLTSAGSVLRLDAELPLAHASAPGARRRRDAEAPPATGTGLPLPATWGAARPVSRSRDILGRGAFVRLKIQGRLDRVLIPRPKNCSRWSRSACGPCSGRARPLRRHGLAGQLRSPGRSVPRTCW